MEEVSSIVACILLNNRLLELLILEEEEDVELEELLSSYNDASEPATIGPSRFSPDTFVDFQLHLRFTRDEFESSLDKFRELGMIEVAHVNRLVYELLEAFALILYRWCWPNRGADMTQIFCRSTAALCLISNDMLSRLHETLSPLLTFQDTFFTEERLAAWAAAIHGKLAPLRRCAGFIDGTFRRICRPKRLQEAAYSGEYCSHGIRFQALVTPDGLTRCLFGPFAGSENDMLMLADTQLLPRFMDLQVRINIHPFYSFMETQDTIRVRYC